MYMTGDADTPTLVGRWFRCRDAVCWPLGIVGTGTSEAIQPTASAKPHPRTCMTSSMLLMQRSSHTLHIHVLRLLKPMDGEASAF
jgi:hypothetical protein